MESEEEDKIEAVLASNEVKEVGLSTRSKRKNVRPPRKPIPKKQVMGRVGRASERRGTKVSAMADEEEVLQENKPVRKGRRKKGQDDTPARSVHLEEVTDDGNKMLRRSGRVRKQKDSSSDSDEVVPRRRLSLDEERKRAGNLPRGRPTRSAQKRKVMERYGACLGLTMVILFPCMRLFNQTTSDVFNVLSLNFLDDQGSE